MGSHAQPKLPIIEFTEKNLTTGTSSWKSTSDSVRQALESYGCFVAAYESISSEMHEAVFGLSEELFSLPKETKMKNSSDIPGFGYGANYPRMPIFEYLGIQDGGTLEAAKKFTNLMWPHGHDKFCETIYSYYKLLLELDHTVVKMVASSYGLDIYKHCDPLIQSSFYLSRFMKYHTPGENENNVGLVPHTDKSFMAIIGTNDVKGLQIETPDGEWIDFEPSPSKYLVIVGEPFMAWSNGRLYCPLHKVTARGTKEKYSLGLFSFIRETLQAPEELVDDENPSKFKPFNHLEFVDYCKEGGPKMKSSIHAYCGI
ncbi:hypothetical protein BUALT_Bualt07G0136000 [Buddleja alternifolia]|uniref:Fe2OG dioxygenase domain-containing protein n=1 Tax=Buddleja alternifolia TaxID=168488 RepID=A0AAV6XH12_9LAMI|nr:hypothetical protein BUALT_Bualt07G0136000 [Buddleja alternifolia]